MNSSNFPHIAPDSTLMVAVSILVLLIASLGSST